MQQSLPWQIPPATGHQPDKITDWSAILIEHHQDLQLEIELIRSLLDSPASLFLQIEARLRRLGRAVLMHLELEAIFLDPALNQSEEVNASELQLLRLGYDDLRALVESTTRFIHREKQISTSLQLNSYQLKTIRKLLTEICNRLQLEDEYYQHFQREPS